LGRQVLVVWPVWQKEITTQTLIAKR